MKLKSKYEKAIYAAGLLVLLYCPTEQLRKEF